MKRLILFELILIFLATTFESDSPPGWFQQSISLGNKLISDIQFLDSLNGWAATDWGPTFDTGYVFRTSNGGNNWEFQYRYPASFTVIQMIDYDTGYIAGSTGFGKMWKTTNGGINWNIVSNFSASPMTDLHFVNVNTGWICSDDILDGGLFKTTDGGLNWETQLNQTYQPVSIFFINSDTGWVGTSETNGRLFKTVNGGANWNLQFTSIAHIESIFFLTTLKGWIRGGTAGTNGIAFTTNSGLNWINGQGEIGGYDVKFMTDSIGYAGGGSQPLRIIKSTDGGKNWGYQSAQVTPDISVSVICNDTLNAWAGKQILIHTTDGGGPLFLGINQISTEIPTDYKLYQNYPNPFNPLTNIIYQIPDNKSNVKITVFDITGKELVKLVDMEQSAGTYVVDWNAAGYSSGVYFYSLIINGIRVDTKKMLMIK